MRCAACAPEERATAVGETSGGRGSPSKYCGNFTRSHEIGESVGPGSQTLRCPGGSLTAKDGLEICLPRQCNLTPLESHHPMLHILKVRIPIEAGNVALRDPEFGKKMQTPLAEIKAQAAYYTSMDGQRGAYIIVDMK